MDDELTNTAQAYYLCRITNGAIPIVWVGGLLDGLEYFPLTLDGVDYILTSEGLFLPPTETNANDEEPSSLHT